MHALWRQVGLRAIETHVALALLFGVVKRVRVQERPDELPAHIFEPEFEMRVLIDRVVPAEKRPRTDHHTLFFGDFFARDEMGRIARSRRGHCGIERMRKRIAQGDARCCGFQ